MQWTDYRPYKFYSLRKNNAKWMGWEGFRDKDEAINRGNYLGVKLTEHMLKLTPCFQLDIWKKIFRIYRKHNTKRWVAYLPHQILFYRSQMSRKNGYGKKTFKKIYYACDLWLWSLQNQHSQKQQDLSYLSPKEKIFSLVQLKIPFYLR